MALFRIYAIDGGKDIYDIEDISKGISQMTRFHQIAEDQGIPLRTLEQVRADLAQAKQNDADKAVARLMLRHGRLTEEARNYVAQEYPEGA